MAGWAGLVTNASPYAIPDGAATEQTNITTLIPGQLTARGGMRPVVFDDPESETPVAAGEVRDCYPYVTSTLSKLLVLTSDGDILALSAPARGAELEDPLTPALAPGEGEVVSNYMGTFHDYAAEPPEGEPSP